MKHSTDEKRVAANKGLVLLTNVGSTVHGTSLVGTDDIDRMGLCVEPADSVIGLKEFDQYIYRDATERTGITNERSAPGDLDLTIYSLRKWMRLATAGNPTVLLPLFVPQSEVMFSNAWGDYLRNNPDMIISRQAVNRFIGYLNGQRERMINGTVGARVSRPELIEAYGFDTKYAGHMVRLGLQGVELMETGRITLPIPEPWRTWIVDLRQGKHTQEEALAAALHLEDRLKVLRDSSDIPSHPNRDRVNTWLGEAYRNMWETIRLTEAGML